MDYIISKINVDLTAPADPEVVYAVQGEQYVRCVQMSVFYDGLPWTIPEGTVFAVRYGGVLQPGGYYDTLPDGSGACSHAENTITVILAPQMMHCAGTMLAQVELHHEQQLLTTFAFRLQVEPNPAEGVLEPETYINWLQWMKIELEKQIEKILQDDSLAGPAGPQGEPAEVTAVIVEYQAGISPSVVPDGVWSDQIPEVDPGKYLWIKTTIIFNQVSPVTFYSVSRMGRDGTGAVSSVTGVFPEADGNVSLTAENVGALALSGGTMKGPIRMDGQPLTGLSAPSADDEAATKGYVDTAKTETAGYIDRKVRTAAPVNLLDNSDFTNPVNQRGITTTSSGFIVDRWCVYDGDVTITAEGIVTTGAGYIQQKLPSGTLKNGQKYTVAVYYSDGTTDVNTNGTYTTADSFDLIHSIKSNGKTIAAVALYEGEYTAETLPEYRPKGYGSELMECMRYYRRFSANAVVAYPGHITGTTRVVLSVGFVPFRTEPTAVMSSDFKIAIRLGTGGYSTVTGNDGVKPNSVVGIYKSGDLYAIYFEMGASPGTNNMVVTSVIASGYLELSADL